MSDLRTLVSRAAKLRLYIVHQRGVYAVVDATTGYEIGGVCHDLAELEEKIDHLSVMK
jgi:hypothetical protein